MANEILVTGPEAKFLNPFLGLGLWTGTWPRACQKVLIQYESIFLNHDPAMCQGREKAPATIYFRFHQNFDTC